MYNINVYKCIYIYICTLLYILINASTALIQYSIHKHSHILYIYIPITHSYQLYLKNQIIFILYAHPCVLMRLIYVNAFFK